MKRALGLMMLVLLACGSGGDKPASSPGGPAAKASGGAGPPGKSATTLKDQFVWGDESQPARDWDADAAECEGRADQDPSVRKGAHPLVRVGVFMQCMQELGWAAKANSR